METTTIVEDYAVLLKHIDSGITIQVHLMYLLLVIICAYGLYRIYTYFFKGFF